MGTCFDLSEWEAFDEAQEFLHDLLNGRVAFIVPAAKPKPSRWRRMLAAFGLSQAGDGDK